MVWTQGYKRTLIIVFRNGKKEHFCCFFFFWLDVLHGSTALLNAVTAFQKKGTLNRDTMKRVSEGPLFFFYFILNESSSMAGKEFKSLNIP